MTSPTIFFSETHERFLRAVVAKLPVDRIIELHLFPSIRQGGTESGVAVVAAVPEGETASPSADSFATPESESEPAAGPSEAAEGRGPRGDGRDGDSEVLPEMMLDSLVSDDERPASMHEPSDAADLAARTEDVDAAEREEIEAEAAEASAGIDEDDAERLEEAVYEIEHSLVDEAAQTMAVASLEIGDLPASEERPRRYTIWSASYRLVLKGLDRGKWEVVVTPEADAPLVTVETVVRGVQRRAGDVDEVGRWTGEELRVALRINR